MIVFFITKPTLGYDRVVRSLDPTGKKFMSSDGLNHTVPKKVTVQVIQIVQSYFYVESTGKKLASSDQSNKVSGRRSHY